MSKHDQVGYAVQSSMGLEAVFLDRDDANGYAWELRDVGARNVRVVQTRVVAPEKMPEGTGVR